MSNLKRAITSLIRQPAKSSIFLLLVFILGILIAGAISVHHAIMHTNHNLRNRMPAVAMIQYSHALDFDPDEARNVYDETGEWPDPIFEPLTREVIREIGSLPQVRYFDYFTIISFNIIAYGLDPWEDVGRGAWHIERTENGYGVEVDIGSMGNIDSLEMRADFIELIAGRSFTEEELLMEGAPFPALIASGFAEVNGLSVGSVFDTRTLHYDSIELEDGSIEIDLAGGRSLGTTVFPLEVIGIFDPLPEVIAYEGYMGVGNLVNQRVASQLQHRIYVSNTVVEEMRGCPMDDITDFFYHIILLNDPLDFEEFSYAVANIPGNNDYWRVMDYSSGFEHISSAMLHLQDIADMILVIAIVATLAIISLLILLFLHDRKHEIGVYLALGSKKKGVIFQIVTEIMILSIIGMTCALLIGNIMARNISQEMVRSELANSETIQGTNWLDLELLGYRFSMTNNDMLDAYEIQLGAREIVWFYVAGLGTVTIATILPIAKIVKTNPKKVLM